MQGRTRPRCCLLTCTLSLPVYVHRREVAVPPGLCPCSSGCGDVAAVLTTRGWWLRDEGALETQLWALLHIGM